MKSIIKNFDRVLSDLFYPTREKDGALDVCPVDAFAGQTFAVSVFGHIRSDISVLMESQSQSEKDLIAQRLVAAQGQDPDNSGLTDSDLFKYSLSRYYQTPNELASWAESITKAQSKAAEKSAAAAERAAQEKAFWDKYNQKLANIEKEQAAGKIDENGNVVSKSE